MGIYAGRFTGRKAVVVGGASGAGRAIAERLAQEGAALSIWDINAATLARVKNAIGSPHIRQIDITDADAVTAAMAESASVLGRIDILVVAAGIIGTTISVSEMPRSDWLRVMDINLNGAFYCCQAVIPFMLANDYGRIVNISSVAGKEGNPNASAYSASKAALISLTKSLGKELATTGIRVNCVTPAGFKTPLLEEIPPPQRAYMLSKIPMGRFGEVPEMAALVSWLASDECSFSTAATFDISGGRATY